MTTHKLAFDPATQAELDATLERLRVPAANAVTTLDSAFFLSAFASVTIGADGLGQTSYIDATNDDLKVAHCANTLCVNYLRRR